MNTRMSEYNILLIFFFFWFCPILEKHFLILTFKPQNTVPFILLKKKQTGKLIKIIEVMIVIKENRKKVYECAEINIRKRKSQT